jgi:organic radical activating enzyme
LMARVSALKFVVSAHDDRYREVPDLGQRARNIHTYVQPMDEYDPARNARNRELALAIASREGYRLSMQWHKMLGFE